MFVWWGVFSLHSGAGWERGGGGRRESDEYGLFDAKGEFGLQKISKPIALPCFCWFGIRGKGGVIKLYPYRFLIMIANKYVDKYVVYDSYDLLIE